MTDEVSRAVQTRLGFNREVDLLEPLDPATSGQARLDALALRRDLDRRRLTAAVYADRLLVLTRRVRDARLLLSTSALTPSEVTRPPGDR